jgi:hypothetical protein
MTTEMEAEAAWLASTELRAMLNFLLGKSRERKFRLFACACCRRVDHLLSDEGSRRALELVEQFHDGLITKKTYDSGERMAFDAYNGLVREVAAAESISGGMNADGVRLLARMFAAQAVVGCYRRNYWDVARGCCGALRGHGTADVEVGESQGVGEGIEGAEQAVQVALLRDIFGNPFRPITLNSSWLTSTVLALVEGIYSEKAFDRMPILADALQDAGCDNEDVLDHCRQREEHVRGCFVVDLLLGKG